jgi:hypothetical protein
LLNAHDIKIVVKGGLSESRSRARMTIAIIAEIGTRSRIIGSESLDAVRDATGIIAVAVAVPTVIVPTVIVPTVIVPTVIVPTVVVRPRRSQREGTNAQA